MASISLFALMRKATRNISRVEPKTESFLSISSSNKPSCSSWLYHQSSNRLISMKSKASKKQVASFEASANAIRKSSSQFLIGRNRHYAPTMFSNYIKFPRIQKFKTEQPKYSMQKGLIVPNLYQFRSQLFRDINISNKSLELMMAFPLNKNKSSLTSNDDKEEEPRFKPKTIVLRKKKKKRKKEKKTMSFDVKEMLTNEVTQAKLTVKKRNNFNYSIDKDDDTVNQLRSKINRGLKGKQDKRNHYWEFKDKKTLHSRVNNDFSKKYHLNKNDSPLKLIQNDALIREVLYNNLSYVVELK